MQWTNELSTFTTTQDFQNDEDLETIAGVDFVKTKLEETESKGKIWNKFVVPTLLWQLRWKK